MSLSLTLACLWVVVAALIAMLPMRRQFAPGIALLLTAPFLLAYLGYQHNPWVILAASIAIISMFRRPLFYMTHRLISRLTRCLKGQT